MYLQVKEEAEYLIGYAGGYFGKLGDLPRRLQAHAEKHRLAFISPVYEIYLHDAIAVEDTNQYLIQASAQARKLDAADSK